MASNRVQEVYLLRGAAIIFDFKSGGKRRSMVLVISPLVFLIGNTGKRMAANRRLRRMAPTEAD